MLIRRISAISGVTRTRDIPVNPEDMMLWSQGGVNIQDAMPYLNDSDREFILSGITDEEWDDAFADDELTDEDEPAF